MSLTDRPFPFRAGPWSQRCARFTVALLAGFTAGSILGVGLGAVVALWLAKRLKPTFPAAIAAITVNPARIFGMAGQFGELRSGAAADVVVEQRLVNQRLIPTAIEPR